MSLKRYAPKRDANEAEIVANLRSIGASVIQTSMEGVPDLLVGYRGQTYLLEVKLPLGKQGGKSHSDLTPAQREFFEQWRGGEPKVVRNTQEAFAAINLTFVNDTKK